MMLDMALNVGGGDGGALWIPLYEGFPRLGQYRALRVRLLCLHAPPLSLVLITLVQQTLTLQQLNFSDHGVDIASYCIN